MICASFIWEPGTYDDEFHRLNDLIQKVADYSAGYIGVDGWVSKDGKRKCANYFWKDMESLQMFAQHPTHLEAKPRIREMVQRLPDHHFGGHTHVWRRTAR